MLAARFPPGRANDANEPRADDDSRTSTSARRLHSPIRTPFRVATATKLLTAPLPGRTGVRRKRRRFGH
jgi:hypothetical protein